MEFYVKDDTGKEQGPIDLRTIEKWLATDRITGETPVRNALMGSWKKIQDIEALAPMLAEQAVRMERHEEEEKGFLDRTLELVGAVKPGKKHQKPKTTYFKNEYLPNPAPVYLRICSGLTDCFLLGFVAAVLFFVGATMVYTHGVMMTVPAVATDDATQPQPAAIPTPIPPPSPSAATDSSAADSTAPPPPPPRRDKMDAQVAPSVSDDESAGFARGSKWLDATKGRNYSCLKATSGSAVWTDIDYLNKVFYLLFSIFMLIALLYFGLGLGIFAQTAGMWFWGIFIVKRDLSEAYFARAYLFSVLLILLGWLTPLFASLNRKRRSLHDLFSGVWIIRISARPKS